MLKLTKPGLPLSFQAKALKERQYLTTVNWVLQQISLSTYFK